MIKNIKYWLQYKIIHPAALKMIKFETCQKNYL
jgi:hypothetical protein